MGKSQQSLVSPAPTGYSLYLGIKEQYPTVNHPFFGIWRDFLCMGSWLCIIVRIAMHNWRDISQSYLIMENYFPSLSSID